VAHQVGPVRLDQLWVADIVYIRLLNEFVYLAVVLDGFSRKVVGWKLDRTLASRLAIDALESAIGARKPLPGLVHHSDRGIQYACGEYVAILRKHEMVPSMSRPANPCDNASCESFIKTLKREEIYANEYKDLDHLRSNIEEFIERYYNQVRLHSALGYHSPEEFEEQAGRENSLTTTGATVDFSCQQRKRLLRWCWEKGLNRRPFPRPHPCLKNQRDERGAAALLQSVKGKIVPGEGFTFKKAESCSNRKLYQERGLVYRTVDDFVLRKPPISINRNSSQQAACNRFNINHLRTSNFNRFQ
jgi:hypothetical protein